MLWPVDVRLACGVASVGAPAALRDAAASAIAAWNTAAGHAPNGVGYASPWANGFPRLYLSGGDTGTITITWGSGAGPVQCGQTTPINSTTHTIQINRVSQVGIAPCTSNVTADIATLLVHELGHALGFNNNAHKPSFGVPAGCTMNLESVRPDVSGVICAHEVEYLLAGYNLRQINATTFWGTPLVTRILGLPASLMLPSGGQATLTATGVARTHGVEEEVLGLGSASLAWASTNEDVATAAALNAVSARVTGELAGEATVQARITSGLPSGHIASTRLQVSGEPTHVTVLAAPPAPFKVQDILGPSTPITTTGTTYSWQAQVVNPPATPVLIRWVVTSSNGAFDSLDTGYGPNALDVFVPHGSYNIRVRAYPRAGTANGAYALRDYPVCTGGGGGGDPLLIVAPEFPSPDVKEGCG